MIHRASTLDSRPLLSFWPLPKNDINTSLALISWGKSGGGVFLQKYCVMMFDIDSK